MAGHKAGQLYIMKGEVGEWLSACPNVAASSLSLLRT